MSSQANDKKLVIVETIMIIAIICTLAIVSFPKFYKAKILKEARECRNYLKEIAYAKAQWALDTKAYEGNGLPADFSEINAFIKGGSPKCPGGGKYIYNTVGVKPECSIGIGVDRKSGTTDDHIL